MSFFHKKQKDEVKHDEEKETQVKDIAPDLSQDEVIIGGKDLLDKHVIMSMMPDYFWIIKNNAIIGLAANAGTKMTVNTTYLKNSLIDNDENFCALELWSTGNTLFTPKMVGIKQTDTDQDKALKIDTYIQSNSNHLNSQFLELQSTDNSRVTMQVFFKKLLEIIYNVDHS